MTEEERGKILETPASLIIAPAGHGKTEMITELVNDSAGKQLILTHTNAGVDALVKRMKKKHIASEKYSIMTIAAFCMKWCIAYPSTATFDTRLSPLSRSTSEEYYCQLYRGCKLIFEKQWARSILLLTYSGLIVDEYQDCICAQHDIIVQISKFLHVTVFGDPLQGIFGFGQPLVNLLKTEFTIIPVQTQPWRWEESNHSLGVWLQSMRDRLMPILTCSSVTLKLDNIESCVKIFEPDNFDPYALLTEIKEYRNVVYLTKWEPSQLDFAQKMRGLFQHDETQDCKCLFLYAKEFDDKTGTQLALAVIEFMGECATGIKTELKTYREHLSRGDHDFSKISKYETVGKLINSICETSDSKYIVYLIDWLKENTDFHIYRQEALEEMKRCVAFARTYKLSLYDSMIQIRRDARFQKRYSNFKYLSSRTLLSKGLEFDCVIVDISKAMLSAKELYVALTRATKMIYIITTSKSIITNN